MSMRSSGFSVSLSLKVGVGLRESFGEGGRNWRREGQFTV